MAGHVCLNPRLVLLASPCAGLLADSLINYWTHGAESVYESVPSKAEEEVLIKSDAGRGVWWVLGDG